MHTHTTMHSTMHTTTQELHHPTRDRATTTRPSHAEHAAPCGHVGVQLGTYLHPLLVRQGPHQGL